MSTNVQVGTILMQDLPQVSTLLGLESEPCFGSWFQIKAIDGFTLDRKIHAAGWNFFFMAPEVKVIFFGARGAKNIQNALQRLLGKVRGQDFNCLEVTGIDAGRFLGVPYTTVSAHSRHIQQSSYLETAQVRRASQPTAPIS
jgi:hypothetical protein